jgi:maleamate amidohydrolase
MDTFTTDAAVFHKQSFGSPLVWQPRFGLLIVDFVNGFTNPDIFGGYNTAEAAQNTVAVLNAFRAKQLPVVHTRIVFADDGSDANVFSEKVPAMLGLTEDHPDSQVVDILAPIKGELVLNKTVPSAFFGTNLAAYFTLHGVRSVVICGATTSGCVRASAVDAMSHGFKPIVLSDCVGDRVQSAHEASVRDMDMKYCAVTTASDFMTHLAKV